MKKPIVIVAVILLVIGGGLVVWGVSSQNKEESSSPQSSANENEQSFDASEFTTDSKQKPLTGENHSLIDMSLSYFDNYDRVVFAFASNPKNEAPGYTAELKDNLIWIRFLDTRDVDQNMENTFEGQKTITGEGKVINKVELWYPQDDSSIGAKIYLDQDRGFRVTDEDLFISVDVNCGCGG